MRVARDTGSLKAAEEAVHVPHAVVLDAIHMRAMITNSLVLDEIL